MFILDSLHQVVTTVFFAFVLGYICYLLFRGARYARGGLTGQPVVKRPPILSPRASKAFHIVASIVCVGVVAFVVFVIIALSQIEF